MNEKQLNHQDQLGKWIKESGHQYPISDFSGTILSALAAQKQKTVYEPVISPLGIKLIITSIISIILYVLLFTQNSENNGLWTLKKIQLPKIHFAELLSFLPDPSTSIILNSSLLAFSVLTFITFLYWSRKINQA